MLLQSHHSRVCRKRHKTIQSDGQVAWQWAYSAFGDEKPTVAKNRFANLDLNQSFGSTTVPAVTFNLRYPGQYFDQESGLHYNYHRSYSATTGRYTQSDPIGLDGGWNRFGYVGQNPLGFTDPLGLQKGPASPNIGDPLPTPIPTPKPPGHWLPDKKCHPLIEWCFGGCSCEQFVTTGEACLACCSTVVGGLMSGLGGVCTNKCLDKFPNTVTGGSKK
jgi:RHS repeat-associated protein